MKSEDSVRFLSGVGQQRADALAKLGIFTIRDLLFHFPFRYEDRGKITQSCDVLPGDTCSLLLTVATQPVTRELRRGLSVTKLRAFDDAGSVPITFFNKPYLKNALAVGREYRFYGKAGGNLISCELTNPQFEPVSDKLKPFIPVYPLSNGLTQGFIRKIIAKAIENTVPEDIIPPSLTEKFSLMGLSEAIRTIHDPDSEAHRSDARRRLAFEELLIFRLGLSLIRERKELESAAVIKNGAALSDEFFGLFPYKPTGAQTRIAHEIASDLASGHPMNRLVQGDVGCGKTAIAAAAIYTAVRNGYQAVLMAPTEILARQHFAELSSLFANSGIRVGLLTGGIRAAERRETLSLLADGGIDIAVGTHALLEDGVTFRKLALVVTDEQHRFGVLQRAALGAKGEHTHTLIMSATPIPRTLALVLYGDLDVSVVDEMPPGRMKIDTFVVDESYRQRIYAFIRKLINEGGQGYIVCPLVEDEDGESDLKDVESYASDLKNEIFPDIPTEFIHGRMTGKQKDAVMSGFISGKTKLLVSTTVIEVGVNVPDAVIMVVENAERFGLSQLHQLRGRVGRSSKKSYCILFSELKDGPTSERLGVMAKTNDGFIVAREDLRLRGPGDFFGERQHGLIKFKLASIIDDVALLEETGLAAEGILASDPSLKLPENSGLRESTVSLFSTGGNGSALIQG